MARTRGSKWASGSVGIIGVEAVLVPLVGEPLGQLEPRLVAVAIAHVGVHVEVVVVVPPLKVLVGGYDRCHLRSHVGPEDFGRDLRMVGDAHRLADVVTQGGHHHLIVGAGPLGPGCRLQAVGELVDGEAVHQSDRDSSIRRTRSATWLWWLMTSVPMTIQSSRVDTSMRVNVVPTSVDPVIPHSRIKWTGRGASTPIRPARRARRRRPRRGRRPGPG